MPANLTPDYLLAETRYRAAREPRERLEALQEMLRVIPKHKGTDHLQGQLKRKIAQLKDEIKQAPKKGSRRADPGHVPSQGAGQVVLLGPPNVGKSHLLQTLTNADPDVAPYPFTTRRPLPGMARFEDAPIQLVDAPAIDRAVWEPWMTTLIRTADFGLVVLDPGAVGVLEAMDMIAEVFQRSKVEPVPAWWAVRDTDEAAEEEEEDFDREYDDDELLARLEPGVVRLPVVVAVTRMDVPGHRDEFSVLIELMDDEWPMIPVSAVSGEGLDDLMRALFRGLRMIRVYSKPPGKPPSMDSPILLARGATVRDMAREIHKEIASGLRYARIWSDRHFEGQKIPRDYVLSDGDVVEMHT